MSSISISPEALAEFIHINCSPEYGKEVIDKLKTALKHRNYTVQIIYDVIEALNEIQPTLNKLEMITYILDTALVIATIATVISTGSAGYAGTVITGAHCLIKNNVSNRKVKRVREAMIEDKKHRDSLDTVLRQQGLELPFEGLEFRAEIGIIHKIFSAISAYITGDSIDWIKHLENIGVVGIVPSVPSSAQQNTTAQSDKSKYSLSEVFKTLTKDISYLQRFAGKKFQKVFQSINAIISLLCNCSNIDSDGHPTAGLLETRCIPELMHDAGMMQELLESLIRNYRL